MSSQLVGALLAVGLGFWAYSDARSLQQRGVKVGRFSPRAWGFGVALVAIFFGVLYLRQRSRAVRAAASPSLSATDDRGPYGDSQPRGRFCHSCGHELPAYVASFCPKCGSQI